MLSITLPTKDWLPPVTRNFAAAHEPGAPPSLQESVSERPGEAASRSEEDQLPGGSRGRCRRRTGGHLGARGSGHSWGHDMPPMAFSGTATLLQEQSMWVGRPSCDLDSRWLRSIPRPPKSEQRSNGKSTRQQFVLHARLWMTRFFLKRALACSRLLEPMVPSSSSSENSKQGRSTYRRSIDNWLS